MKKIKHNKNKLTILIIVLSIVLILILLIYTNSSKAKVCIKENCFNIKLATTQEQRQQGLMQVPKLDEDKGMFFIFQEEEINPFWMKNTLIPLDIIWINSSLDVVYIKSNAIPCNETCDLLIPEAKSLYTLEINANLTEKYNIKLGDKVIIGSFK
jgi:hypothetical protein